MFDVAHNPAGFENLLKAWNQHYPGKPMNVILGLSADKDIRACLMTIAKQAEHLFLVQAESKRAASINQLEKILIEQGLTHFTGCQTMAEAVQKASACHHDILICGSFYIMKHAREEIFRLQVS